MPANLYNDKAINAALYVISHLDKADFHKIFKILYFADQKHLANYGRTVTGERYIAMRNGPVPSLLYDIFKIINGESELSININFSNYFEISNDYHVTKKKEPNLDILSKSDIECLDESINENKKLNFHKLTEKAHDKAWENANNNEQMSHCEIAKVGGANAEMLKYIKTIYENSHAF